MKIFHHHRGRVVTPSRTAGTRVSLRRRPRPLLASLIGMSALFNSLKVADSPSARPPPGQRDAASRRSVGRFRLLSTGRLASSPSRPAKPARQAGPPSRPAKPAPKKARGRRSLGTASTMPGLTAPMEPAHKDLSSRGPAGGGVVWPTAMSPAKGRDGGHHPDRRRPDTPLPKASERRLKFERTVDTAKIQPH